MTIEVKILESTTLKDLQDLMNEFLNADFNKGKVLDSYGFNTFTDKYGIVNHIVMLMFYTEDK
jgi:hypothetical protein